MLNQVQTETVIPGYRGAREFFYQSLITRYHTLDEDSRMKMIKKVESHPDANACAFFYRDLDEVGKSQIIAYLLGEIEKFPDDVEKRMLLRLQGLRINELSRLRNDVRRYFHTERILVWFPEKVAQVLRRFL